MLTQTFFSSHLLCYYLEQSTKTSLVPGHPSFLSLPLHLTCMDPSLFSLPLIFYPSPPWSLLFFLSLWCQFSELHFFPPSRFQPLATTLLDTAHACLPNLISPCAFSPLFIPGSSSFFCLFSVLRVLHRKHFASHGEFKSLFFMQANCHTQMCMHTSSYVTKSSQRTVHQ